MWCSQKRGYWPAATIKMAIEFTVMADKINVHPILLLFLRQVVVSSEHNLGSQCS